MSISILNIPNSFIQSTEDCDFTLPVMSENDIKFQLQFFTETTDEAALLMDADVELFAVKNNVVVNDDSSFAEALIGAGTPVEADIVWRTADKGVATYWASVFSEFESIALNQCFRLAVRISMGEEKSYFLLNCFKKVIEDFVSTIEYSCIENNYGFNYCDQYVPNKVRLPFYLGKPNRKADRNIYFKSNGQAKVTKSVLRKEYEASVDYLPDLLHEKLHIALEHETVFIESAQYTGEVRISEDYEVKWTDLNEFLLAPAAFKVNATPYGSSLNNCADCETWEETTCSSAIQMTQSGIDGDSIYAQWQVTSGTPSKFIVKVNGEEKIRTTELTYYLDDLDPGTYTIAVTSICVAGTTEIEGEEQSAELVIPEPETECYPAGFLPRAPLADAQINNAYLQIFTLIGTQPFTITSVNKPAWMNIYISGFSLFMTGTPYPGSEGNNVAISVTVENCNDNTAEYSSSLNVVGTTPFPLAGNRIWDYEENTICSKPLTTVYLAAGNYAFAAGLKVYTSPALTTIYSMKYLLDTDGNLWKTNILGQLQFVEAGYC